MFAQSTTLGKQLANNASFSTSSSSSKKKIDVKVSASNVKRNPNMAQLRAGYLFPEIARIRNAHLEKNPDAKIISLGIGDTTVGYFCVCIRCAFSKRAKFNFIRLITCLKAACSLEEPFSLPFGRARELTSLFLSFFDSNLTGTDSGADCVWHGQRGFGVGHRCRVRKDRRLRL